QTASVAATCWADMLPAGRDDVARIAARIDAPFLLVATGPRRCRFVTSGAQLFDRRGHNSNRAQLGSGPRLPPAAPPPDPPRSEEAPGQGRRRDRWRPGSAHVGG